MLLRQFPATVAQSRLCFFGDRSLRKSLNIVLVPSQGRRRGATNGAVLAPGRGAFERLLGGAFTQSLLGEARRGRCGTASVWALRCRLRACNVTAPQL